MALSTVPLTPDGLDSAVGVHVEPVNVSATGPVLDPVPMAPTAMHAVADRHEIASRPITDAPVGVGTPRGTPFHPGPIAPTGIAGMDSTATAVIMLVRIVQASTARTIRPMNISCAPYPFDMTECIRSRGIQKVES
jgi:hypothetical protein